VLALVLIDDWPAVMPLALIIVAIARGIAVQLATIRPIGDAAVNAVITLLRRRRELAGISAHG
jgi:hypothetical protein